jgi:alpha-ribazole phosphatase
MKNTECHLPGAVLPVPLWIWRHPRPDAAAGRCIGQTNLAVSRRRAKRLAHRVRQAARRQRLPREVWTSPLRRCADVARWLRRWGWRHHVDENLTELHFGRWDGQRWSDIPWAEVQAWEADFAGHAPGGGESLQDMAMRVRAFVRDSAQAGLPRLVVGHAGWINTLKVLGQTAPLSSSGWPAPPGYARLITFCPGIPGHPDNNLGTMSPQPP